MSVPSGRPNVAARLGVWRSLDTASFEAHVRDTKAMVRKSMLRD